MLVGVGVVAVPAVALAFEVKFDVLGGGIILILGNILVRVLCSQLSRSLRALLGHVCGGATVVASTFFELGGRRERFRLGDAASKNPAQAGGCPLLIGTLAISATLRLHASLVPVVK